MSTPQVHWEYVRDCARCGNLWAQYACKIGAELEWEDLKVLLDLALMWDRHEPRDLLDASNPYWQETFQSQRRARLKREATRSLIDVQAELFRQRHMEEQRKHREAVQRQVDEWRRIEEKKRAEAAERQKRRRDLRRKLLREGREPPRRYHVVAPDTADPVLDAARSPWADEFDPWTHNHRDSYIMQDFLDGTPCDVLAHQYDMSRGYVERLVARLGTPAV